MDRLLPPLPLLPPHGSPVGAVGKRERDLERKRNLGAKNGNRNEREVGMGNDDGNGAEMEPKMASKGK